MTDRFDLDEKVAIVTGGAGVIGEAISIGLADHGATVVIADIDEQAQNLAADIGPAVEHKSIDITDPDAVRLLINDVIDQYESIDVLVNAAYPRNENWGQPYEDMTIDDWQTNVDLHLNSYFYTAYQTSLVMKEQEQGGSIINLASIYGVQAPNFNLYNGLSMTQPVEYAAIKGGIINLTRFMASYLGRNAVRVNTVSPGGIFDDQHEKFVERYENRTPLGRMADPEDIVGAVVFLASDAANYITGHNLIVDGGWTIS